jgi:hypothetical protein
VISLNLATPKFLGSAIAAALLLASCSREKPPQASSQATSPPKSQPALPAPVRAPAPLAGLTPLPSSNQVVASVSSGRVDPFAPLATPATASPARLILLRLPPGLIFNGVISSGGTPEALVQFGAESGTLRVGQRGGRTTDYRTTDYRTTPLLPVGWSVASIDVQNGRLTLRQGKQAVTAEL